MQSYKKNINLLIVKIPCIIMSVLMLCALILVVNSQITELTSNFNSQCKQYDTSINLLLSKFHNKAVLVTKNPLIADNLEIDNFPVIHDTLSLLNSSSYNEVKYAYIVNSKNEKLWRSYNISEQVPVTFENVSEYNEITLLYSEATDTNDGVFSLIYPIYNSNGSLSGGLVLCFETNLLLKSIPYNPDNPLVITVQSPDYMYKNINDYLPILYSVKNQITVPGTNVTITLRTDITPVIKTSVFLLILFLFIIAVFYWGLSFFAHCVNESINQPIKEMQETIQNYTNSVTKPVKPGSEKNEE